MTLSWFEINQVCNKNVLKWSFENFVGGGEIKNFLGQIPPLVRGEGHIHFTKVIIDILNWSSNAMVCVSSSSTAGSRSGTSPSLKDLGVGMISRSEIGNDNLASIGFNDMNKKVSISGKRNIPIFLTNDVPPFYKQAN